MKRFILLTVVLTLLFTGCGEDQTANEKSLQSLEIVSTNLTLGKGNIRQLQVLGHYSDATVDDITSSVTAWSTNNSLVATVDASGVLTGVDIGSAIITASYGGLSTDTNMTILYASGSLDTSFDATGYTSHANAAGGGSTDEGYALVIDQEENILVAGYSTSASNGRDMAIWKYHPDGTLDTSFNSKGYVTHDSAAGGNLDDCAFAMAIDSNGKIVLAGLSTNIAGNYDMTIWRYNSNGTLDTTFNGVGYVTHHNAGGGNNRDVAFALATDTNEKIVVAGYSDTVSNGVDMTMWRYNSNGTLDTTFNGVGYKMHNNAAGGNSNDGATSIALYTNGNILVSGYSSSSVNGVDMTIWRFDQNGNLDTNFNSVGYVTHDNAAGGNSNDIANAVTIDQNQSIIATGYSTISGVTTDMTIWRYTSNGTLDTTFNSIGYLTHNGAAGGNSDDAANGLIIDPSGKIIVSGYSNNASPNRDMTLWRYDTNGTLDISFNSTGYVTHHNAAGGNYADGAHKVVLGNNGKLYAAGRSTSPSDGDDMAIWCYK